MNDELRELVRQVASESIHNEQGVSEIPTISDKSLLHKDGVRFSGTEWASFIDNNLHLTLLGLGGIGSNVAYQLARLNPKAMHIVDNDRVGYENISGQWFTTSDVGAYKADVIHGKLERFLGYNGVRYYTDRINANSKSLEYMKVPVMITGFDNMKARKESFEIWRENSGDKPFGIFIDARCSIDHITIYAIPTRDKARMDKYLEEWFSDEEADATICTLKQTTYVATLTGSLITATLVNYVSNYLDYMKAVPFKQDFDINNLMYTTQEPWLL